MGTLKRMVHRNLALHLMAYCTTNGQKIDHADMHTCTKEIENLTDMIIENDYSVLIELGNGHESMSIVKDDQVVFQIDNKDLKRSREYFAMKCYFVRIRRECKKLGFYERHASAHISSIFKPKGNAKA